MKKKRDKKRKKREKKATLDAYLVSYRDAAKVATKKPSQAQTNHWVLGTMQPNLPCPPQALVLT